MLTSRSGRLKTVADTLQAHRDELLDLAVRNGGNTRGDAKFDVDGAIHTLSTYAELGQGLGEVRFLVDGEGLSLARSPRFHGQHLMVPRRGVAVHVNAFNFPAWGLAEKAAVALLAGVPVVSKPATSGSSRPARGTPPGAQVPRGPPQEAPATCSSIRSPGRGGLLGPATPGPGSGMPRSCPSVR